MATKARSPRIARQAGYVATIAVCVVLWWAVGRLVGWGWPPFLTEEFDKIVPWYRLAFGVEIAFNVAFLFYDPRWFVAIGDAIRAAVNATVAYLLLRLFPFDFSAYDFNWERFTRIVLILAIVATWITAIANVIKAGRYLAKPPDDTRQPDETPTP